MDIVCRGGIWYFVGGAAFFITACRRIHVDKDTAAGQWFDILNLIGVMSYMAGAICFTYLAITVHNAQLREQRKHAIDLVNALVKSHAVSFELALEHAEITASLHRSREFAAENADAQGRHCGDSPQHRAPLQPKVLNTSTRSNIEVDGML